MSHVLRRTSPTRPHQRATVYLYERYTATTDDPPHRALAVTASGSYSVTDIARALFTTQRRLPFAITRLVSVSLVHNTDLPVPLTPASIKATSSSSETAVLFGQHLHPDDAPDALNVVLANPAAFRAKGAGPVYEFRYTPLDDAPPLETLRLASITSPRLPSFDIVPFVQEHGTCWVHAAFHMLAAAAPLPVHTDTPLCRRAAVSPRSLARANTRHLSSMHTLTRSIRGTTDLDAGGKPEDTAKAIRVLLPTMFADIPHILGGLVTRDGDITLYAKQASPSSPSTAPAPAALFLATTRTPRRASVIAPPFRLQPDDDYAPPPRTVSLHGAEYTLHGAVITTRHSLGEHHAVAGVFHRSTPYILNSWAGTQPIAYDWTQLYPDDILVDNVAIRAPVARDYATAGHGLRPYLKIHGISALLYIRSDIPRLTTPRMTPALAHIIFPNPPSSGGKRSTVSQKKKFGSL